MQNVIGLKREIERERERGYISSECEAKGDVARDVHTAVFLSIPPALAEPPLEFGPVPFLGGGYVVEFGEHLVPQLP